MRVFFKRVLAAVALALGLSGCATAQSYDIRYNADAGEFTAGYSYCKGKACPAPESFGEQPKYGKGWHQITVLHTDRGLEFYRDEQEIPQYLAETDPMFAGALMLGFSTAIKPADSKLMESAYRVIGKALGNGYIADTVLLRGVQRPQIAGLRKGGIQLSKF